MHRSEAAEMAGEILADLLIIDPGEFRENFDRGPFLVKHRLSDHPLFQLERLLQLAKSLPTDSVEFNAGNLPIGCDPDATPRNGLSAEETVRRIETCKSWMALKNVEADPDYDSLLEHCLAEVGRYSGSLHMQKAEAFIFLSSPGSITPYHMDPEHNFLLQIRGSKFMTVFDRSVVPAQEAESFHLGAHRNMIFNDAFLERSVTFELKPGDGLHVPVAAPHFVCNGSSVSVSFSITFRTPDLESRALVHRANSYLRKLGLRPAPVGEYLRRDMIKALAARVARRAGLSAG